MTFREQRIIEAAVRLREAAKIISAPTNLVSVANWGYEPEMEEMIARLYAISRTEIKTIHS